MKNRRPFWLARVAVVALALSTFPACDDSTGPGGDLDPTEAAAALDGVVNKFFDGNDAVQSLAVFDSLIGFALAGGDVAILDLLPLPKSGTVEGLTRSVQASLAAATTLQRSSALPARIPVGLLGKTFIYNPATGKYELDPTRTDAPTSGVRFVLYAVDPVLGEPVLDAQGQPTEIGWIDITDTSSFPTVNIGLTAVVSGVTLIDVDVSGTFTQTTLELTFAGFLSDGSQQLNFDFDLSGTQTGFEVTFNLSFAPYTISFTFSGSETSGNIQATLSDGDDTIVFNLGVDAFDNISEGSGITINGELVAIISGNVNDPVVTNAAGEPLTQAELEALGNLFEAMGDIFELFEDLAEFALFLLVLGTI